MGSARLLAVGVALGCIACAGRYPAPPAPLLERAFVAPSWDHRDTLYYEAQVATNIFLFDDLVDRERDMRDDALSTWQRASRLVVMPLFRIRQLRDSSAAVRTPSFNPSLRFEKHYMQGDTVRRAVPGADHRDLRAIRDFGWRLEWTHHSNGQAGCFFSGYTPDTSGDPDKCTAGAKADKTGIGLNTTNGDFSTTYWGLTGFWRRVGIDQVNQDERWALAAALGYQLHRFGIFGDMRDEQRSLYGTHRGRMDASYHYDFGTVDTRIDGLFELAEHTDSRITPWRGHIDLSVRSPYTLGTGLIVRYLGGQDYYNIGFAKWRSRILVGLLFDPSSPEGWR